MDNARNSVNLFSGIIHFPRVGISWSASETYVRFYFSNPIPKNFDPDLDFLGFFFRRENPPNSRIS